MKITKHRPKHIDQTQNPYFVTGRTYFGLPYFDTDEKKELALLSAIKLACRNHHLALDGWVVLDNHHHLLFRPPGCTWNTIAGKPANSERKDGIARLRAIENFRIGKVVGTIHGKSSSLLNEIARLRATQIADKSAISLEERNGFERSEDRSSKNTRTSNFSCDEEIADKSANSERNSTFKCNSPYAAWSSAKYWEEVRHRNIALYGNRSQLAEEKRSRKFQQLLKQGTPQELADFVKKIDRVWYQYTDHVIRDEGDYFRHLNYIHQNPVKHGYVKDMGEYQFSSYHRYLKERGKRWLADCFTRYPIVDFMPKGIGE